MLEASGHSHALRIGSFVCRAIPAAFFALKCVAFWQDYLESGRWTSLAWIVSEGLVVFLFVVRRPSQDVSRRRRDWFAAIGGTLLFMLASPGGLLLIPQYAGLTLQITGLAVQVSAKIALGRSFGAVAANRGIVMSGPYRWVRHPMYLGYFISHVGFLLTNLTLYNAMVYIAAYSFQLYRIVAEERLLMQDDSYRAYTKHVGYRLLPGVF